jgi:hypothetical protein
MTLKKSVLYFITRVQFFFRIQTSFNEVLKTHVMMFNDYIYEFVSNIASLKIIDSS